MGNYLAKPVTDTNPVDEKSKQLSYGASCMQGWRISQEDAHCCLLNYDEDTALFGVFDGHGGAEVARYTAAHFPEYLKALAKYKDQKFEDALKDAFVEFDRTLIDPTVVSQLKALASESDDEDVEDEEEDLDTLKKESKLPFGDNFFARVMETAQKLSEARASSSKRKDNDDSESDEMEEDDIDEVDRARKNVPCSSSKSNGNDGDNEIDPSEVTSSSLEKKEVEEEEPEACSSSAGFSKETEKSSEEASAVSTSSENKEEKTENIDAVVPKTEISSTSLGKGRKQANPEKKEKKPLPSLLDLLNGDFDSEDDSETDDEYDEDDDGDSQADTKESDEEDEEEEDDEEEDDDEDDEDDEDSPTMFSGGAEIPGRDSGCTAVVALLHKKDLWVANAGDSRCVLSRGGNAVEMSFDHKPESEEEYARIKKAGGIVTSEGRVNGGLNLSRAIGDHSYKENNDLDIREQMITALPDVKHIPIEEEDEFMVIACDGIWNSMTSQEVIDFIRPKLKTSEKLSAICDELFHNCLSENTKGDGTGCDNMTAVIVRFNDHEIKNGTLLENKVTNGNGHKRPLDEENSEKNEEETTKKICTRSE